MGKISKINSSTGCNKEKPVGKFSKINSRTGVLYSAEESTKIELEKS